MKKLWERNDFPGAPDSPEPSAEKRENEAKGAVHITNPFMTAYVAKELLSKLTKKKR